MVEIRVARSEDLTAHLMAQLQALLADAFHGEFTEEDWSHTLGGWHVMAVDEVVVAHAAVVERRLDVGGQQLRTGYVEGVATASLRQREGLGAAVMRRIGDLIQVGFDLGALSTSSHRFYERQGWERWQGPTFVRCDTETVRTADEDDGIMVLRHGTTADLDLTLPITCAARSGDDW